MSDEPKEPMYGASCLPGLAKHLCKPLTDKGTLDAVAGLNNQYVVVHLYLVPGDATERLDLRVAIEAELANMNATKLHHLAFAVPVSRTDERNTAELVWNRLISAGAGEVRETRSGREKAGLDAWQDGDVIYVHYMGADGICVLAAAPKSGQRLSQALEI